MKALLLMLGGAILIAVAIAYVADWGGFSLLGVLIGIVLGIWGLVANHRDHTARR